jgi:hypothetical protein
LGIELVVHDAADEVSVTAPHVPAVEYVLPSVEYSKLTVPVAPEVTETLIVTEPPAACELVGDTLVIVVELPVKAQAGVERATLAPATRSSTATPDDTTRRTVFRNVLSLISAAENFMMNSLPRTWGYQRPKPTY